jgi:hypothetical protein
VGAAGSLPEEIFTHHRRHFPRLRFELCLPRGFPSLVGALLSNDGVRNLELAVRWTIEAGSVAGTLKLLRWGFADWANSGHGQAASEAHPSPAASVCPTWKDQHDS